MRRVCYSLALVVGLLSGDAWAAIQQAFLVQNSGWMEPFYTDPSSRFKPLVSAVVEAVTDPDDTLFIAAFNQTTPENESPRLVYPDTQHSSPKQAIDAIELARKSKAGALADTDFQEAVRKTIAGPLQGKPGIIWIFTNNKNSPNNSPETAKHNQAFYDLLHRDPSILRTLVFPLAMSVKGGKQQLEAHGLMVYALAFGEAADTSLRLLIEQGRAKRVFTQPPARLKPLNTESVHLIPQAIVNSTSVKIGMASDGKTTVLDVNVSSLQSNVDIKAAMENLFYPYAIDSAMLSAKFAGQGFAYPLTVSPSRLDSLPPGSKQDVAVIFPIPLAQIPSIWSLDRLSSFGTQTTITGSVEILLQDQRLTLDQTFKDHLNTYFKGDPLSNIFIPSQEAESSRVAIPISVRVTYPVYPVVVLIGVGVLLGIGLLLAWHRLSRPRYVHVRIDGHACRFVLALGQSHVIRGEERQVLGEIKRVLTGVRIISATPGHRIEIEKITD